MKELGPIKAFVESKLNEVEIPQGPNNLYEPIRYFLNIGGKRIRPILTILAGEMYGENVDVTNKAIALELFHNFTLMHDDIMDEAPMRRNQETVHKKWNTNIGILSGDALLIKSYQYLLKDQSQNNQLILDIYNQIALQVCEGQQMDIDFEDQLGVTEDNYIEMIRKKTAVLIGCSLQIGAMATGADDEDARHLYSFGEKIGIAFQLKDDYLDAFANPETFGKQIGGDILANKKTYLLIRALEKANDEQREAIFNCFDVRNPSLKLEIMLNLYRELEVAQDLHEKMQFFYNGAMDHLKELRPKYAQDNIQTLIKIADFFMYRDQ